jgi:phosphatidate cytidylyltransferase
MSELMARTLAGMAMIALALVAAVMGGYVFAVLVAGAATIMYFEWTRLVRGWGIGWHVAGFLYALVPAVAVLWIREIPGLGLSMVVWVFVVVWSTDIGAFFAGRAIGGPKLAPSISPNKTFAGLIGGMVSAGLAGWAWVDFSGVPSLFLWLGPPLAFAAQAGDLFESWLKRRAKAKDSGTWLPGHGGLLDRADGLVVVAPLTVLILSGLVR